MITTPSPHTVTTRSLHPPSPHYTTKLSLSCCRSSRNGCAQLATWLIRRQKCIIGDRFVIWTIVCDCVIYSFPDWRHLVRSGSSAFVLIVVVFLVSVAIVGVVIWMYCWFGWFSSCRYNDILITVVAIIFPTIFSILLSLSPFTLYIFLVLD